MLHDCEVAEPIVAIGAIGEDMGTAKPRLQLAIRVGVSKLGQVETSPT